MAKQKTYVYKGKTYKTQELEAISKVKGATFHSRLGLVKKGRMTIEQVVETPKISKSAVGRIGRKNSTWEMDGGRVLPVMGVR